MLKRIINSFILTCRYRLVVRTGRCGRPDGGSILPGDIFLKSDLIFKILSEDIIYKGDLVFNNEILNHLD